MREKTATRTLLLAAVATALIGAFAVALPSAAVAKHKKNYNAFYFLGAPIPDRAAGGSAPFGRVDVKFFVGKKFNHRKVSDLLVSVQTTGLNSSSAGDLEFVLTAPTGQSERLLPDFGSFGGQSIGPLTFSAHSGSGACNSATPPCGNPFETLNRPFVGTALDSRLGFFKGLPMRKFWTLSVLDTSHGETSVLNTAGLFIKAG